MTCAARDLIPAKESARKRYVLLYCVLRRSKADGYSRQTHPWDPSHLDRALDVTKLREDLLLKLERERSEEVAGLRSKQKQVGAQAQGQHAQE